MPLLIPESLHVLVCHSFLPLHDWRYLAQGDLSENAVRLRVIAFTLSSLKGFDDLQHHKGHMHYGAELTPYCVEGD